MELTIDSTMEENKSDEDDAHDAKRKKKDGASTSNKIQRTARTKLGYIRRFDMINAAHPSGKGSREVRDLLKLEYARTIEGPDFELKSLNKSVNKWRNMIDELKEEDGRMRRIGNTIATGAIGRGALFSSSFTREMMDNFVLALSHPEVIKYIDEESDCINGARMIEASSNNKTEFLTISKLLFWIKSGEYNSDELPTEEDIKEYILFRLNHEAFLAEINPIITTLAIVLNLPDDDDNRSPQPTHSDVPNSGEELSACGWGEQYQGSILLTADHPTTIAHYVDKIPFIPTIHQVTESLTSQYATEIPVKTIKKILNDDEVVELLKRWGRLIFTSSKTCPNPEKVEQYYMKVMHGNHPHKGPGCDDRVRMVLFFTGKARDSTIEPYKGTQMTKEKLLLKIIRNVRENMREKKEDEWDHIAIIAYFYQCFAEAVQESLMYDSFDGTLDKDQSSYHDFRTPAFLASFSAFVDSCGVYRKQKTLINKATMELMKSLFVNFTATKIWQAKRVAVKKEQKEADNKVKNGERKLRRK